MAAYATPALNQEVVLKIQALLKPLEKWRAYLTNITKESNVSDENLSGSQQQAELIAAEQPRNLGYRLYKALQEHGGWRVGLKGWRPYRGVIHLLGHGRRRKGRERRCR